MKYAADVALTVALLTGAGALLGPDVDGNVGVIGRQVPPQTEGVVQHMVGQWKNDDEWGLPCSVSVAAASWGTQPDGVSIVAAFSDGTPMDAWQLDANGVPAVYLGMVSFWDGKVTMSFDAVPTEAGTVDVAFSAMTADGPCAIGKMHWEAGGDPAPGGSPGATPSAGGSTPEGQNTAAHPFSCNNANKCRLFIYFSTDPGATPVKLILENGDSAVVFSPPAAYAVCSGC